MRRITPIAVVMLLVAGLTVSACRNDHPGNASDHHNKRGDHDQQNYPHNH